MEWRNMFIIWKGDLKLQDGEGTNFDKYEINTCTSKCFNQR